MTTPVHAESKSARYLSWIKNYPPVMIDEKPSMTALAVRTLSRADDTPVSNETTTNIFSGTRKRDDS